ncbi:MAG: alpha/beta hydrolase [Lentisphaeria bacterium]|nr:alpha/beta hydrolase [Lentisphaeria bacterium]
MRIELYKENAPAPNGSQEDFFAPYMDTFLLRQVKNPCGAVLVLPGGGYNHRAFHEGDPIAEAFNRLGYHAFVLQYRVQPYTYPAPQMDAARAIKIIRANAEAWGVQPDKIAVCGFSAGGHLAACAGMLSDRYQVAEGDEADNFPGNADAMLLCYGVLSTTWTYTDLGRELPSGTPYRDENGKEIDPWKLVDDNTPPAYVWHTATDKSVPVECSVAFAREMWKCQRPCELHIYPEGPHGRGLAIAYKDIVTWSKEAATFLEKSCGFPRAIQY